MNNPLSTKLLTPETSVVLIIDYQQHVLDMITTGDHEVIELNGRALARAAKLFGVPVVLSTIGQKLRGDEPTLPSIRAELAEEPEHDRNTMNSWEDEGFLDAVRKTGRNRLIFAGLTSDVCLQYPVLHAQREGWETYFVADAVGGLSVTSHLAAYERMVQAGSQPLALNSLICEWIRDWGSTPHGEAAKQFFEWYMPQIGKMRERLHAAPFQTTLA